MLRHRACTRRAIPCDNKACTKNFEMILLETDYSDIVFLHDHHIVMPGNGLQRCYNYGEVMRLCIVCVEVHVFYELCLVR